MKFTTEHMSPSHIAAINLVLKDFQAHSPDWTPQKYVTWCVIQKTSEIIKGANEEYEKRKKEQEDAEKVPDTFMHDLTEPSSATN